MDNPHLLENVHLALFDGTEQADEIFVSRGKWVVSVSTDMLISVRLTQVTR